FGHQAIKELVQFQKKIIAEIGKEKVDVPVFEPDPQLEADLRSYAQEKVTVAVKNPDKLARQNDLDELEKETVEHFAEIYPEQERVVQSIYSTLVKETVRGMILEDGVRPDGRRPDEIRKITSEVGILPRAHGSGIFTRGQTQVLTAATLGTIREEQVLDDLGLDESKRYIHHYNFPSYCVGETRPMRGPGRREIGHGALAEKALLPVIPDEDQFPYTLRL
ncbi:MAG TPA: polyribonucleotide nucleotidyltransferase, partial [Peptococcaceae bacterium]|nr:polyribonucleotide nucleotidyltransferase [Peptococcaceae bacterium]